jgi:DNA-binding response OmpR family regulator
MGRVENRGMTVSSAPARSASQPASRPLSIAVVDADRGFMRVLTRRLDSAGWEHHEFNDPLPLDSLAAMRLNALVLDVALLGSQAWDYLDELCVRRRELAVVVCTGPSTVAQRVCGLRAGADDWVTKPSHPEELIARVEAVVRRRRCADLRAGAPPRIVGELRIWGDEYKAFAGHSPLDLTRREFELLLLLAEAEGRVLERERIYERVWGYAMMRGDRSIDVYVRRLRRKLQLSSPRWRYIHTHFGIGYRLAAEPQTMALSTSRLLRASPSAADHPAQAPAPA